MDTPGAGEKIEGAKNAAAVSLRVVSTPHGQHHMGQSIPVCFCGLAPQEGHDTGVGAWASGLWGTVGHMSCT